VEELQSRISRVWYINPYGQEIQPPANPRVIEAIRSSQAIIYSIGSLFTSLIPSIILRGVGQAIYTSPARHKILILNGSLDRETGPSTRPFTALDFVEAIVRAGEESRGRGHGRALSRLNGSVAVPPHLAGSVGDGQNHLPQPPTVRLPYTSYVTHLLHLEGPGTPYVDRERLSEIGIECVRLYGRKVEANSSETGMRYDPMALIQALEVVLGKKGDAMIRPGVGSERSRRNTMVAASKSG
jgi:hypothetical protein